MNVLDHTDSEMAGLSHSRVYVHVHMQGGHMIEWRAHFSQI